AQSTPHACPPSHPVRVLLRFGGGFGFVVGAPPRCERGQAQILPKPTPRRAPHHNPAILSFTPAPITPWIYPNPPSRRPNAVSQATYQSHRLRLGRVSET